VLLDLRDLTFVDSTGLRTFLNAQRRAKDNGHRLALIGASDLDGHKDRPHYGSVVVDKLADRWGPSLEGRKTVWFEIDRLAA
jgi:hypothetical protein